MLTLGGLLIDDHRLDAEHELIHREIFDETLEECERLLFGAEQEVQKTRRAAEIAARRRTDELVKATSAALDELTEAAESERAEARRERLQAENYRLGAEQIQSALSQEQAEIEAERKAMVARREQLDTALAAAESLRGEAEEVRENAQGVAAALLEAAAVRAELLESTLDERIAEVAATLATLQDLVLDRSDKRRVFDEVNVRDFLSTTFREIREYREAELSAAGRQADDLIERAQLTASEIVADKQRERERLLEGADPRSVLDVVTVLLAESRPAVPSRADEPGETDATDPTITEPIDGGTFDDEPIEPEPIEPTTTPSEPARLEAEPIDGGTFDDEPIEPEPIEPTTTPEAAPEPDLAWPPPSDPIPVPSNLPPPPSAAPDHEDEAAAAAIAAALGQVEDPSRITDRELADLLNTTDQLMGEHATIDGALDLARSLADALGPGEADAAPESGTEASEASVEEPAVAAPEHAGPETDVSIDLSSSDDPIVSLDVDDASPSGAGATGGQSVGPIRSFWRSLFSA